MIKWIGSWLRSIRGYQMGAGSLLMRALRHEPRGRLFRNTFLRRQSSRHEKSSGFGSRTGRCFQTNIITQILGRRSLGCRKTRTERGVRKSRFDQGTVGASVAQLEFFYCASVAHTSGAQLNGAPRVGQLRKGRAIDPAQLRICSANAPHLRFTRYGHLSSITQSYHW
jgi:hypothetical protein